ncbi:hypothetical protein [Bradyrhizobium lablabi]|nr:hypothetical protein [Bradyrhizobium lablabi]
MSFERVYKAAEDMVGLGQYGRTLIVLTCSSVGEQDHDEEDEQN